MMHKLDRTAVEAPSCLTGYDYRTQTWDDLETGCKQHVRRQLKAMQGQVVPGSDGSGSVATHVRCAYCERAIYSDGHIEHFRRKNPKYGYPELTFAWDNLFLSCDAVCKEHCGHYKDRKGAPSYNSGLLIKPDVDDPEHFLYFHSSGEVRPRQPLDDADRQRAEETIRVFGLDNGSLTGARRRKVGRYLDLGLEESLGDWPDDLRQQYLLEEIEKTRWEPYATTIKHFLLLFR